MTPKQRLSCALVVLALVLIAASARAGDIRFDWDASPSANVTGYRVYGGSDLNDMLMLTDVPGLAAEISGLPDGCLPLYFHVVAHNSAGESEPSPIPPMGPLIVRPIVVSLDDATNTWRVSGGNFGPAVTVFAVVGGVETEVTLRTQDCEVLTFDVLPVGGAQAIQALKLCNDLVCVTHPLVPKPVINVRPS